MLAVYKSPKDGSPQYAKVKGITSAQYDIHKAYILDRITFFQLNPIPSESYPYRFARSFLSIFYHKEATVSWIDASVMPSTASQVTLDAFAVAQGFSEWLTHNSGAGFNDAGVANNLPMYTWNASTSVSHAMAQRIPFRLKDFINNQRGYLEYPTATGSALKKFYDVVVAPQTASMPNSSEASFPFPSGYYFSPGSSRAFSNP